MPFKNSEGTICRSVRSVVTSILADGHQLLLICVDDNSIDNSRIIVEECAKHWPKAQILLLDGPGKGPATARNIAIDYIKNSYTLIDYVAFCDSDDYWTADHLRLSVNALSQCDMCYSYVNVENEFGNPLVIYGIPDLPVFDRSKLLHSNYIFISTVVMKFECLDVGYFNDYAVPMEDWDYWIRVSEIFSVKKAYSHPHVTYTWKSTGSYYTHDDSMKAKEYIMGKRTYQSDFDSIISKDGHDPMSIDGWLSKSEGDFLADNAVDKKCIEIGSYKGRSTCFIAPVASIIVCIDTFKADIGGQTQMAGCTTYGDFANNTSHLNNIVPVIGLSQNVHAMVNNDEFDFIFIDGMHDFESVSNDVQNYLPKLKDGAVIMFHDYFKRDWPDVVLFVDKMFGGPDELVDTVAKVILTTERRFALSIFFTSLSMTGLVVDDLNMSPIDEIELFDDELSGKIVVIAPWSAQMQDGMENAKNYPYWIDVVSQLSSMGIITVQIGRSGERIIGCDRLLLDQTVDQLKDLINNCDTFLSVDSFLPHFSAFYGKKGVVIFGKSDPEIFGHSMHINILKSRKYLRPDQFRWWNDVAYEKEAFVLANEVVNSVIGLLKSS